MALEHQGDLDCRRGTKEQRAQSGALQDSLGLSGKGNTTWFPAPQTPKELPSLTRLLSFPLPLTATGPTCTEGAMKEKPGRQGRGWVGGRGLYLSGQVIRKGFPEEVTFQLWPAGFRG